MYLSQALIKKKPETSIRELDGVCHKLWAAHKTSQQLIVTMFWEDFSSKKTTTKSVHHCQLQRVHNRCRIICNCQIQHCKSKYDIFCARSNT